DQSRRCRTSLSEPLLGRLHTGACPSLRQALLDPLVVLKILGGARHHASPVARGRAELAYGLQQSEEGGVLQLGVALRGGLVGLLAGLLQQALEVLGIEGHGSYSATGFCDQ